MENRINQKKYIPLKDYSPIDPAELPADLQDDLMNLTGAIPIWEQPGTQKDSIALISRNGDLLRTEGYIGFVQIREYQIFIKSRFDGENDNNFTNYLISKALDINARLFDRMHVPAERARAMEKLLAVAFVQKVRQAYKKGIFRQYRTFERNDAKVKGKIDFTRHIKYNPLPNGRIAYSYREYTPDNDMNRLFLTAYEELMKRHGGLMRILLERERTVTECITKMKNFVSPVSKQETQKLLKKTNKKIRHSIYKDWEDVRKISLMVLRHFGYFVPEKGEKESIGVVVSVAGLWENYLLNLLRTIPGFEGIEYQKSVPIFQNKKETETEEKLKARKRLSSQIIMDFYIKREESGIVLDAKYKPMWSSLLKEPNSRLPLPDFYQVMFYANAMHCEKCGILCPVNGDGKDILQIRPSDPVAGMPEFGVNGLVVPSISEAGDEKESYEKFKQAMKQAEENFKGRIKEFYGLKKNSPLTNAKINGKL